MPLKLYRRKGRRIYNFRGTIGPAGRRKFFSGTCNTENKDIAARQIAEIESNYWKGSFDGPGAILTFAHAASLYRAARGSDRFLDKIEKHLGNTLVKDITSGMVREMALMLYPNCSGVSLNRLAVIPTSAVINFCAESELCPAIKIKRFKGESKTKDPATLEWVLAFCAHAGPHLGTFARFMFLTGCRPGEAIALQWSDLDLQARTAVIRQGKVAKSGGTVERVAHLPDMLVVALANLSKVEGRGVFIYKSRKDAEKAWDAAIVAAGIKRLTPHCCRHGFATSLLHRGIDVVTIAKLGGWKSPAQVFATYGHAKDDPTLTDILTEAKSVPPGATDLRNPRKTGTS
jgi:integrase